MVANGGLGNGVQQEELHGIFHAFGTITAIAMLPRKPYAFISFSSAESASAALAQVHGRELQCPEELSLPGVKFYLAYVEHGKKWAWEVDNILLTYPTSITR